MTLSLFFLGFGVSPLIIGPLSDYLGRKKVLLGLLGLFLIANISVVLTHAISGFIFWRFVMGFSACFASVLASAIIRDIMAGSELAMAFSRISMLWAVVPSLAPIVGGYLITFLPWQTIFAGLAILTFLLLIIALFLFPETMSSSTRSSRLDFKVYLQFLQNPDFMKAVLLTGVIYAIFNGYLTFAPAFLYLKFGLSPAAIGWLQLVFAASYFLGNIINSHLLKKMKIESIINLGQYCLIISTLAYFILNLAMPESLSAFMLSITLITASLALIFANYCALALTNCRESTVASASALLGSTQMIFCFISSYLVALMADSHQLYYGLIVVFATIAFLVIKYWPAVKPNQ